MSEKKFSDMTGQQGMAMGLGWGVAVIAVIALIVVSAGGTPISTKTNSGSNTVNTNTAPTPAPTPAPAPAAGGDISKISPVTDDDNIKGGKNAKVTVIEFSDFQCPFCTRHNPTIEQILSEYGDDVRVVFRHFPLSSIHPQAQKAAEASECAAEQGKFWEMHDLMFANQSALGVPNLKTYASQIGLNKSQFDSCLDDGKYASLVQKQTTEAQAAGITGTPGTFVNGTLVKGAYPFATFQEIIDAELAK